MFAEIRKPGDEKFEILALVALLVLIFVPALFSHEPWHFDELRYLEVARQMGEYGDWFIPHINGQVYKEKPPVFFWCVASAQAVTQLKWQAAGVLMVGLSLSACVFIVRHIGKLLFKDSRLATLAAAMTLTFVFVIDKGTRALLDPFFMMLTTASTLGLLYAAIHEKRSGRILGALAGAFFMSAACMTKGPVGIIVILIAAATLGLVWRGRKGVSITALAISPVIAGGLTLLWVYLVSLEVGQWYFDNMVFRQTKGRAVDSFMHGRPWWMYLANLPRLLMPWLIIAPAAVWGVWRARKQEGGRAGLALAAVFGVTLVFFSSVSGKRMGYLMPLFPFMALILAWGLQQAARAEGKARGVLVSVPLGIHAAMPFVGVLVALGTIVAPIAYSWALFSDERVQLTLKNMPAMTPFVCAAAAIAMMVVGITLLRGRRDWRKPIVASIATAGILTAALNLTYYPAMDAVLSAEPLALAIKANKREAETLVFLNDHKDGRINFYMNAEGYEVVRKNGLERKVNEPGRLWVAALERQWKDDIPENTRNRFELIVSRDFAGSTTNIYAERTVP